MDNSIQEQKTNVVLVTYWTCGTAGHRHTTEEIAKKCAIKRQKRIENKIASNENKKRNIRIVRSVLNGASFADVGREFNLSRERVRQITVRTIRQLSRICVQQKIIPQHRRCDDVYDPTFWQSRLNLDEKKLGTL